MTERNYWQRMRRKQMSRRALLRASGRAGIGAAGLALVGCGDDDDDGQQSAAQAAAQQQQQQQAMQQQGGQQSQQQAMQQQGQQGQQEAAAESQADQADQQEQSADDAQEQQQAAVSEIVRGGNLTFSTPAATHDYFDPGRAVFGPTQFWMGFYMNYLIRYRNKEQDIVEPDIASLPEIPDDETYIFRIDQGARFWDQYPTEGGRLVTAEDIRVNYQRQIDSVDATGAEDGTFLTAGAFRRTSSMEVPDETTWVAKTDGPDATWMGVPLRPFSWITSPEAINEFGDRWRDEAGNLELSSGTGMMIPHSYDPDIGISMSRNPDYWKMGVDGLPLPYYDEVTLANMEDATTVDAAYRGKEILNGRFPLSTLQADGILSDFPDHGNGQIAFGFTIITLVNYNPDWPGEDGLGNPWVDRRFAKALGIAVDPYLMIDTVYLGSGKPTGLHDTPWYSSYWALPEEELLQTPGFRPDRDADIAEARALLEASGYDKSRGLRMIAPDIWEGTYPGVLETEVGMYRNALDLEVEFDVQPYTVILQRFVDGTYPGSGPQWGNPPAELDPTAPYNDFFTPEGSVNTLYYDYPPMAEIAYKMRVTLDREERWEMAQDAQRLLLGTHPDHGLDGITTIPGVMNGISPVIWWPFVHHSDDVLQFAHASHRYDETWIDVNHPDYPA